MEETHGDEDVSPPASPWALERMLQAQQLESPHQSPDLPTARFQESPRDWQSQHWQSESRQPGPGPVLKESLQHMSQPHAVREPAITLADAAADFDLILTLPLPEAKLVVENELAPATPPLRRSATTSAHRSASTESEAHLLKGLQLSRNPGEKMTTTWLIDELQRRIEAAGLICMVLKLLPKPDAIQERAGQHEVESGHMVTLVCIGAAKVLGEAAATPHNAQHIRMTNARTQATPVHTLPQPARLPPSQPPRGSLPPPARLPPPSVIARAPPPTPMTTVRAPPTPPSPPSPPSPACSPPQTPPPPHPNSTRTRGLSRKSLLECGERFPRLEEEAEGMKLPTVGIVGGVLGPHSRFRRSAAHRFPPFNSKLRQRLLEQILQTPMGSSNANDRPHYHPAQTPALLQSTPPPFRPAQPQSQSGHPRGGAGLDLNELLASGRVREVIHVHDQDEKEQLKHNLVYGVAGVCPLRPLTLESLFAYSGANVAFYFTYLSAYTRSLHLPALLGALLWVFDVTHFDAAVAAQQNATHVAREAAREAAADLANASTWACDDTALLEDLQFEASASTARAYGDAAFVRLTCTALLALVLVLWSACFAEYWKRRQAMLGRAWGTVGDDAPPPMANPHFRGKPGKGVYRKGLWVPLDDAAASTLLRRSSLASHLVRDELPTNFWFSSKVRQRRQVISACLLVLLALACLGSIFLMQLFAAYMRDVTIFVGSTDVSSTLVSLANACVIGTFNVAWRKIALALAAWENYHLHKGYMEHLTYKLFLFQCINCYFSLFFLAFLKPYGVRLFGVDTGKCDVVPPPGGRSCADEVRSLLASLLVMNMLVGQVVEVATVVGKGILKHLVAQLKEVFVQRGQQLWRQASGRLGHEALAAAKELAAARAAEEARAAKKAAEEPTFARLVAEYERPCLKSIEQGLGPTFLEFNEIALQYGFVLFFSVALPVAPLLALANNLIEVRSDALKMIYVTRRVRADDSATGIGPWESALKLLSYVGIVVNLLYLGITTDFFDQLAHHLPPLRLSGARVAALVVAEHFLLLLKVVVDWLIPDVSDTARVRMEREEYLDEQREKLEAQKQAEAEGSLNFARAEAAAAPTRRKATRPPREVYRL